MPQEEMNPENHQQIASLAIKKLAENTGSKYGVAFAEEFRYEGFAPARCSFPIYLETGRLSYE